MNQLIVTGNNALTSMNSTDVITIESIVTASKAKAKALSPASQDGTMRITTLPEALDEDGRRNLKNQVVIGAKEGAAEAISSLVGSNITDGVLYLLDGKDYKGVDKYTL